MTVSEFMFLAIGLLLGVASGAALIEIVRARPPARREVRLTVSQDAIPRRRATTLADDAFVAVGPEPARGGPADRREMEGPAPLGALDRRTNVLEGGHPGAAIGGHPKQAPGRVVGMPISAGADPMLGALQASGRDTVRLGASATAESAQSQPAATAWATARARAGVGAAGSSATPVTTGRNTSPAAVGLLDRPDDAGPVAAPARSGPCAEERRLAEERCELAIRAQAQGAAAADALRRAQRACDTHTAASTAAAEMADPRVVRSLKEGAQRDFRAASRAAGSPEAVEAAARRWLLEINRINRQAAAASLTADREREAATVVGATLERLGREANAARIGAEMADAACLAARTAVADCDERTTARPGVARATPPPPIQPVLADDRGDEALGIAFEGGTAPRIFRLLRGDDGAMETLVAVLGGDDPEEQRRWKLALAGLRDTILADAIEQAFLRFPHDHPFWGPYTQPQNRDIIRALASLGHRFDGLGGWADERLPSQRELSLALGYAGLDPMRVRQWPSEQQTAELFRDVEVAADEYLAGMAGDLTLAEMVEMLGRRADSLVELWNHWGRLRPLLLEEA